MAEVIVFAGTTEGYSIAGFLKRHQVPSCICTATEYGASQIQEDSCIRVRSGRMNAQEMEVFLRGEKPLLVIDATHPYAEEATGNIRSACENAGISCLRVLREGGTVPEDVICVDSAAEAARYLSGTEGNILLTTGSKELKAFTEIPGYTERIYARVLPLVPVLESCQSLGLTGGHLIGMQGPFSKEMNSATLRQYNCRYLVTKDTGKAGGFREKADAAHECNAVLVVIGRPCEEQGISVFECRKLLSERFGLKQKAEVTLAGIGMGSCGTLTEEGKEACREAELIIGAKRVVDAVRLPGQSCLYEYRTDKIVGFIREHPEYEKITVVFSGDVGFYSGAGKLMEALGNNARVICGISCVSYFMSKTGMSWDDAVLASTHGRNCNLIGLIRENKKVFAILGSSEGIRELAGKLVFYGMGEVLLYVGERLSYKDERIFAKKAAELTDHEGDPLSVVLAVNADASGSSCGAGIPDRAFIREKVPMTKEEIRMVSVGKLRLNKDSVCYDIGAGTGSVAVQMAGLALQGAVYAVEKNPQAVSLIEKNRIRFCADNLHIISGTAPDILSEIPAPTHVFIGGSSGRLKEIIKTVLSKNPEVRIVINCITLETLHEVLTLADSPGFEIFDVVQITAARAKDAGRVHMMTGENPVYVMTLQYPKWLSEGEVKV